MYLIKLSFKFLYSRKHWQSLYLTPQVLYFLLLFYLQIFLYKYCRFPSFDMTFVVHLLITSYFLF